MKEQLSRAEQDYLKAIYKLEQESGLATTQGLAQVLDVKPPSVTDMIKHLAEDAGGAYVTRTPYRGVTLTARGQAVALEMVRHHRLLELFLATQLDVPWDRVHGEAERLEHVLSEDLEERIAAKLGHPTRDPHGDPIPRRDGTVDALDDVALNVLASGTRGTITRVPDGDPALLRYLGDLGLVPGAAITVEAVTSYGDVRMVSVGEATHALGDAVARRVLVKPERGERVALKTGNGSRARPTPRGGEPRSAEEGA